MIEFDNIIFILIAFLIGFLMLIFTKIFRFFKSESKITIYSNLFLLFALIMALGFFAKYSLDLVAVRYEIFQNYGLSTSPIYLIDNLSGLFVGTFFITLIHILLSIVEKFLMKKGFSNFAIFGIIFGIILSIGILLNFIFTNASSELLITVLLGYSKIIGTILVAFFVSYRIKRILIFDKKASFYDKIFSIPGFIFFVIGFYLSLMNGNILGM